jgi:rhodanese-related sulfurtransferase
MQIIDVRTPKEFKQDHVEGAINVPFQDVPKLVREGKLENVNLEKKIPIIFICKSGFRSYLSTMLAMTYNYEHPLSLFHGMDGGWLQADLPVINGPN